MTSTHGSAYLLIRSAKSEMEIGCLNKALCFSYAPCQSCGKENDKALDDGGLVPGRATQNFLHQVVCTDTETHPPPVCGLRGLFSRNKWPEFKASYSCPPNSVLIAECAHEIYNLLG